jgi:two-component system, OmpR family, sensor kinase
MLDSVRTRLTLWYIGVLALALALFSVGVYSLLGHTLRQRLDEGLRASIKAAAASLAHEIDEGETSQQAAQSTVQDLFIPHQALAVFDAEGRLLDERHANDQAQARLPELSLIPADQPFLFTIAAANGPQRVAAQRMRIPPNGTVYLVAISQSFKTVTEELDELRQVFFITVPLALLLAGVGGWLLACKSLAPVVAMSESARRISAENLGERLPVANPRDELGQLAATFNQLLVRLDAAFAQQRQFMADASHELRTPLSVLRTAAAVTLEQPHRAETEYRDALALVHEQARRLTRIVEEMFTLARADAGRRPIEAQNFYLDELVTETARAASVLAGRKNIAIEVAPTHETPFRGDEDLLRQLLLNLLDNAIKFTPAGGAVRLELEQQNGTHQLSVADTGGGIPAEAQPHIFERFYRVDKARSRAEQEQGSGAGLGLSIARWIAEAHGGSLRLAKSTSTGSTFIVKLPAHSALVNR